jgi:type IX secretion system PorP/SprF family membrane protein
MEYRIYRWGFAIVLLAAVHGLIGQQLPNSSHISQTRTAWNPALTASGTDMITDAFFRMQWIGFAGAPVTGYASLQYPFIDYNMSGGLLLQMDKTGPVSKTGAQLNYAYKLPAFLSRYGQLSLGISGSFHQYSYNGSSEIFNQDGDLLILNNRSSRLFPSIGGGFYYNSNTRSYRGNSFFVGAAVNQLYTTKVLVNDFDQKRAAHIHFNAGGRFYNYDSFLEPMITVNYVNPEILDVLYSLNFEMDDAFWAGVGYASSGMASIQGGVILDEFGSRYARLRMGVLANYSIVSSLANTGPGFEFYISYNLDMD